MCVCGKQQFVPATGVHSPVQCMAASYVATGFDIGHNNVFTSSWDVCAVFGERSICGVCGEIGGQ